MPYLLVGGTAILVAFLNWPQTGMMLGWDNLMTQFDVKMNIGREVSGVWQEYQGLGLLAGMGHAADLVRLLVEWSLTIVLRIQNVRVFEILSMLVMGAVGMVWLLGKVVGKENKNSLSALVTQVLGGLFYLLSIGAVQNFWVPFEPYYWAYGMVPWLLGSYIEYYRSGSKRDLILFTVLSLIATPIGYLQTIYVVYLLFLGLFGLGLILQTRTMTAIRRIAVLMSISILMNAFWLLPQAYFFVTSVKTTTEAKMNQIASPEVGLSNNSTGSLGSVLKMDGYWLQLHDYQFDNSFEYLMQPWVDYFGSKNVDYIRWMLVGIIVLGVFVAVWKRRNMRWGLMLSLIGFLIILQGDRLPFGYISVELKNVLPILDQIFRSPFTKVIVFWNSLLAMFFAIGTQALFELFWNRKNLVVKILGGAIIISFVSAIFYVAKPVLEGHLFYKRLNVQIPNEYKNLFHFFNNADEGRIAKLPAETIWGWQYNEWGYRGSGFLWYGIEQPILDRAFDVWSPYNEGFYQELSTALYANTRTREHANTKVQQVLQKYDVRYVLLDESVIAPGQDEEILRIGETKQLAQELGWEEKFHENFLTVWEIDVTRNTSASEHGFISAPPTYAEATAGERGVAKVRRDVVWDAHGAYVTRDTSARLHEGTVYYPFAGLMREEAKNVEYGEGMMVITGEGSGTLTVPGFAAGERVEVGYSVQLEAGSLKLTWEPLYKINGEKGPQLTEQVIPTDKQFLWVKIGENEATFVEEGRETRGQARLTVGEPFVIKLYDGVVAEEQEINGWQKEWEQACGEEGELRCFAMRITPPGEERLLQTINPYDESNQTEVCLDLEGEPYECVNEQKRGASPVVLTQTVRPGEAYWLDYVIAGEAETQPPSARWYNLNDQLTMTNMVWEGWGEERVFALQGEVLPAQAGLKVEVAGIPRVYDFANMGQNVITNCDVLGRGWAEKVTSDTVTRYSSDERGAVCDYVEVAGVSTELPYLMRVRGENVEGRSVKIFLHNTGSKRNDIEYLLDTDSFDQSFVLLPWGWEGMYTLNTETRSFGQYSENLLGPVEARYLPLEQIAGMRVEPSRSDLVGLPTRSDLRIQEIKKTGTWLYRVTVEGGGLLKLSQGYDEGWVGVGLEHVKVDGWANGWFIDQDSSKQDISEKSVVIFYWPQMLEYLGFVILGLTFVFLIRSKKHEDRVPIFTKKERGGGDQD